MFRGDVRDPARNETGQFFRARRLPDEPPLDAFLQPVPGGQTEVFQHHPQVTAGLGVDDVPGLILQDRLAKARLLGAIGQFLNVVGERKPSRGELVVQALPNVCDLCATSDTGNSSR